MEERAKEEEEEGKKKGRRDVFPMLKMMIKL